MRGRHRCMITSATLYSITQSVFEEHRMLLEVVSKRDFGAKQHLEDAALRGLPLMSVAKQTLSH